MYADEAKQVSSFNRRAFLALGGMTGLTSILVGRLYFLQVLQQDQYVLLAEQNRLNVHLIAPVRGRIFDRNGEPLAVNRQNYRALIIPEQTKKIDSTLKRLAKFVDLDDEVEKRIHAQRQRSRQAFVPIEIQDRLSWEEVSRIEVNAIDLPGVIVDAAQRRIYPEGEHLAHIIGYVAGVDSNEIGRNKLFALPGFKIGKAGIEQRLDDVLRGRGGTSQVEVNAAGRIIKEVKRAAPVSGGNVWCSIDTALQKFVHEKLSEFRRAAAVVMNIHSGEILAMCSVPSYNPNLLAEGIDEKKWQALTKDPDHPLTNKAVTGLYPPGSTFKLAVAMAAAEEGIPLDFKVRCKGSIQYSDRRYHCWKRHGHGTMDAYAAIRESCDVWFYRVGEELGIDKIAKYARRLGFGIAPDIDLSNVKAGLIPNKDWKRATLDETWYNGETLIAAIGQGYCLTTPLQNAIMVARLASGGYEIQPTMYRRNMITDPTHAQFKPAFPSLGLAPSTVRYLQESMVQAVNDPDGTAFYSRSWQPDWLYGGKTGTSQVRTISEAERATGVLKNEDIEWLRRDHALFVGYAPIHAPQYAVSVLIEHSDKGSGQAARLSRDFFDFIYHNPPDRLGNNNNDAAPGGIET